MTDATGDPVNLGEAPLNLPRTSGDESTAGKLLVSGRIPVIGEIVEECAGDSRPHPFDSSTRYPDCEGFESVYHAVILAVTRTRVSSWPLATTWTAHSK